MSPEATGKGPVARRGFSRRALGLFLAAVLTLGVTSLVLERMPRHQFQDPTDQHQSQPANDLADTYGIPPEQLYEIIAEELANSIAEDADPDSEQAADAAAEPAAEPDRSTPTTLRIDELDLELAVEPVGTVGEPFASGLAAADAQQVGWFEPGATPGEAGNAVFIGASGDTGDDEQPAVFATLDEIRLGDQIEVDREGEETATFQVETVRRCPADFPSSLPEQPYTGPTLHLVACDDSDGGGVIVTALLVAIEEAEAAESGDDEEAEDAKETEEAEPADADDADDSDE